MAFKYRTTIAIITGCFFGGKTGYIVHLANRACGFVSFRADLWNRLLRLPFFAKSKKSPFVVEDVWRTKKLEGFCSLHKLAVAVKSRKKGFFFRWKEMIFFVWQITPLFIFSASSSRFIASPSETDIRGKWLKCVCVWNPTQSWLCIRRNLQSKRIVWHGLLVRHYNGFPFFCIANHFRKKPPAFRK